MNTQHEQMSPADGWTERNRQAQARYRKRHADDIARTRKVAGLLMLRERKWDRHRAKKLAVLIRTFIGRDCTKQLAAELRRTLRAS